MLADAGRLLRIYWTLDQRERAGSRIWYWISFVVFGGLMIVLSGVMGLAAGEFVSRRPEPGALDVGLEEGVVPGLLLTIVLLAVLVTGFNQALKALFLSDDLDQLMVAPIRSQAVMAAKLLSRLPISVPIVLALTAPALIAFGFQLALSPIYYLIGLLMLLVAPLFGVTLGALVAMLLVRWLPAKRLSEYVGAVYIVFGMILAIGVQLPRFLNEGRGTVDPAVSANLVGMANTLAHSPLPTMWAGRGLMDMGRLEFTAAWSGVGLYLLITLGLFVLTVLLADKLYLSGWLRMQGSGSGARGFEEAAGLFAGDSLLLAIAYKDWLLRLRDPRLMATVFSGVVFTGFLLFVMLRPQDLDSSILMTSNEIGIPRGVTSCAFVLMAGWMLFGQIGASVLSLERASYVVLKSAPISAARLLWAKVLGVLIAYAVVVTGLLVGVWFVVRFNFLWTPYGWVVLLLLGCGVLVNTAAQNFVHPKLDWDDPRRMTSRAGRLSTSLTSIGFTLVGGLIAVGGFWPATRSAALGVPSVLLGLGGLATYVWFFVQWQFRRVNDAWIMVGETPPEPPARSLVDRLRGR